jgi:acetyl-CoA synthetase
MEANDLDRTQIQDWLMAYGESAVVPAALLCDRHATDPERLAARCVDAAGREAALTFAELRDRSAHFAGVLRDLGVTRGDRVATLLPKSPELLIATLAIWRLGAVHLPFFTAFGPQAIAVHVEHGGARVLVTDAANRPKLDEAGVPPLRVIAVEGGDSDGVRAGDVPFWRSLEAADQVEAPVAVGGDDPMIQIYTSGTTGQPKGVPVPVKALAAFGCGRDSDCSTERNPDACVCANCLPGAVCHVRASFGLGWLR